MPTLLIEDVTLPPNGSGLVHPITVFASLPEGTLIRLSTDLFSFPTISSGVIDLNSIGYTINGASPGASAVSIGNGFFLSAAHNFGNLTGDYIPSSNSTPQLVRNFGMDGNDAVLFQTDVVSSQQNSMIIFSDPNDASGNLSALGFPGFNPFVQAFNGTTLVNSSGSLEVGRYSTSVGPGNFTGVWTSDSLVFTPGFSGGGVFLEYTLPGGQTQNFLAGIVSTLDAATQFVTVQDSLGQQLTVNTLFVNESYIEPIGDSYQQIANALFSPTNIVNGVNIGGLAMNPNSFAINTLVADAGGNITTIVQGTGFNENIISHAGTSYTIRGEGGYDTVDYRGIAGTITATLNGNTVTVVKTAGGTDTLTGVEAIHGTNNPASGDTFIVASFAAGRQVFINGHSPTGTPQEEGTGKSLHNNGVGGPEDCIIIDPALLAAGAAVTYLTNDGEGVIYLGDERVTYSGIHHVPQQDPADYFWGTSGLGDVGASVGLGDVGDIIVDLSGVVGAITDTLLSGVSLWNLVDSIEVGAGDVSLDLGAFGINTYDASELIGRSPNNLSSGQIISVEGHGSGAAGPAANDNFSCAALAI